MIRSLYSGISGMRNHQIRMDVVGNNIANVNTTGFKAGRVNFQDALSQTIRSGGDGTNPAQVGSGMSVGSISNNFSQGPKQSTGRTLDMAIDGNGFFVVKDSANNEYYTREGIFFMDDEGYLVNGDGLRVQSSQGDIRVYNGPISTISVGPNGAITGTNTSGDPLMFTSGASVKPQPTKVIEASLVGGAITNPVPIVSSNGSLAGDAIVPAVPPVEAKVAGNSDGVVQLGISLPPVDMSGAAYELTIEYNDGNTTIGPITLNGGLNSVSSWQDLATKLQAAIDGSAIGPNKVKVSYNESPFGSLVFETITDPDATNGAGDPITPSITLGGAGVAKYMGSVTNLSNAGTAVVTKDWSGRTFSVDVGDGWHNITTDASFNAITSGNDLASKLQALIDAQAGGAGNAKVKVTWDTDHLVFTPASGYSKITLGGPDLPDFVGAASTAQENNMDWSKKDISVNYNGTTYTFTEYEMKMAGLNSITSGSALAAAMKKLINTKIGSDKVDVTWSTDHLVFNTKDTTGLGIKPNITITGADADDFIGNSPIIKEGTASMLPPPASQEPNNVIKLATFQNPEGLTKAGRNLFQTSASSGR
ncbi:flagellar basal body rod protein FlgG [Desulforamulus profundi]|uniref:Flagellar hook protein FlgE n=1 Tax=Desulforamulus profundi TaxID=1383067 RepID=A0A2C6MH28_9FIRM|nr:flagellar hook-basal body complex protein [Desulforamulus profundi]PHJ39052.1 flagellar basal body rod protein FlgG [Desulforamulus profundi]